MGLCSDRMRATQPLNRGVILRPAFFAGRRTYVLADSASHVLTTCKILHIVEPPRMRYTSAARGLATHRLTPRAVSAKELVMRSSRFQVVMLVAMIGLLFLASTGSAQNVTALYNFNNSNSSQGPEFVTPAQGRDGKLYGTTVGSVFRIATDGRGGQLFAFDGTDGAQPFGGVTLATNGNFYGTTFFGGAQNDGVLFEISSSGKYTVLHEF